MNHGRYEEFLALALYDELEPREKDELARHLADCAACRALEVELAQGIGALRPTSELAVARVHAARNAFEVSDGDFDAALARALAAERPAPRWTPWIGLAASFAAGVLGAWLVLRGGDAPTRDASPATADTPAAHGAHASPWQRFHADLPPPPSTSAGSLAHLLARRAR